MDYKIIRSKRRTLCVQIVQNKVVVRSPFLLPKAYIERFLREKDSWIKKTLQKSSKKNELRENQIYFLGKKRELLFGDIESISNDTICLKILGRTSLEKKKALQRFLNKETAKLIGEYLNKYDHFAYKSIKFSYYLSRWGSCSPQNDLTFNIKLAMCPPQVIEYVVVHELCHIEVKNHSKHFWSKVSEIFPDYSLCRKWLRDHRWYI